MGKRIVVNVETCVGCHSCELACAIAHSKAKTLEGALLAGERPGRRIYVESFRGTPVPVPCNHCEEAACIMACPTGAAHRKVENGPVFVDHEKCIGCRMCVQACPFGVMAVNSEGKGVLKCDLCIERLVQSELPACVSACPTHSLSFGEDETVSRGKRQKVAEQMAAAQKEADRP